MRRRPDDLLDLLAVWDRQAEATTRVGLLLPWANQAVETELPRLRMANTIFHYARLVPPSQSTALDQAFWHGLRKTADSAVHSMRHLPLNAVVLACTSAGFTGGPALPTGVVTAFDAVTTVLKAIGAARVVLATPYPEAVTTAEATALAAAGITVTAHASLGLEDGYPSISPGQVRTLLQQPPNNTVRQADAVVLSCTGWHTLAVLPELQREWGRPVLSSNLAMALYTARIAMGAHP
ncbi:hypothetical protein ACFYZ9_38505 [Streptomyces sp. NPDC001691]|uniref:aspartate racemase/maleate isomerase family protein n=1 Tax=Streptomyces sp. NPDC001691 TaxID=3364600 RepID=UPI0036789B1D